MTTNFKVVRLVDIELEVRLDNNIKGPWVVVESADELIKSYPFNGSISDCYAYTKLRYYGNI